MFGYLRETKEEAEKAGIDKQTNLPRTGLEEYLNIIFPNTNDWIHDKPFGGDNPKLKRKRPDYKSNSLKLIIEFDGLPHYQSPIQIRIDEENTKLYQNEGYKVIRIPYFIQLTKEVVKQLFDIDMSIDLFPDDIPSLGINNKATPAFLPMCGIKRMTKEFKLFPEQYRINIDYLKSQPKELDYINGWELLEEEYNRL